MSNQPKPDARGEWLAPIEGLRGISILLVLTAHIYSPGWRSIGGGFGVTIFFVLSGFLITRLLLQEERRDGAVSLAGFYIRRAFRLFPAYYLVLAIYCVVILVLGVRPFLRAGFVRNLPFYLFYLQEIPFLNPHATGEFLPFYQSWSLGIEEKFYFVWPWLAFVGLTSGRARIIAGAAGTLLFSIAPMLSEYGRYLFPYASICAGCVLALAHDRPHLRARLEGAVGGWRMPVAVACLVLTHVGAVWGEGFVGKAATLLYPLPVAAVLVASLSSPALGRLLSVRPLTFLGGLSYGIYLIHLLVRNVVDLALSHAGVSDAHGALVYLTMLGLSAAGAWIMNAAVETPSRLYGRSLARRVTERRRAERSRKGGALEAVVEGQGAGPLT